jgi:hypothetical protein
MMSSSGPGELLTAIWRIGVLKRTRARVDARHAALTSVHARPCMSNSGQHPFAVVVVKSIHTAVFG